MEGGGGKVFAHMLDRDQMTQGKTTQGINP